MKPRGWPVVVSFAALTAAGLTVLVPSPPADEPTPRPAVLPRPAPLMRELLGFRVRYDDRLQRHDELVRTARVEYTAWNGRRRLALVVVPRWYGPREHPPIPLVISSHGRGLTAAAKARFWGGLPAFGPFAAARLIELDEPLATWVLP